MSPQLSLFAVPPEDRRPSSRAHASLLAHAPATRPLAASLPFHHDAPKGTSEVAAKRAFPRAKTHAARILALIVARGRHGLTDDEGQRELGILLQSYVPQRVRLLDDGLVRDSKLRRRTVNGFPAAVWVATTLGDVERRGSDGEALQSGV